MNLALIALGLALPVVGGFTVALATALKVTPLWMLGVLAMRRPRTTLPGIAAAVVVAGGACLLVFGLGGTADFVGIWITAVMPSISQGQFWGESLAGLQAAGGPSLQHYFGNLSISFFPVQLAVLSGWDYAGGDLPVAVRAYLTTMAVGAPLTAAWLTRNRSVSVQATSVLAAALLAAPIVRPYVLPVLLLVAASFLEERRQRGSDHDVHIRTLSVTP